VSVRAAVGGLVIPSDLVDHSLPSTASDADPLDVGSFRAKLNAARRSPQEETRLCYDKDRRNGSAESDKVSRKTHPRHKRHVNKANRLGVPLFRREMTTVLTTTMTTVGLPDTLTYATIELVRVWSRHPPVRTDQKVGGSNPFGRAQVRGPFRYCAGGVLVH
jgi:hypothetical protein